MTETENTRAEPLGEDMPEKMNIPDKQGRKRVVIIGGGFGGLEFAKTLKDDNFQIVLLDKKNHHIFQPLLYQVSTAGIEPSTISFPFRSIFAGRKCFHIRVCEALEVLPDQKILRTSIGDVDYDYLVIATGADTNYFGNKKLEQSTMALKTTSEALYNRNQLLESFELALATNDPEERKKYLTFVVVGGGATGVELVGALAEMRKYVLAKDYPDLDIHDVRILLVDGAPRLLAAFSEKSSTEAANYLKYRNVELMFNTRVIDFEDGKLKLPNEEIQTYNVFWTAGIKANGLKGLPEGSYGPGARIKVNEFCQVEGCRDIYAIGDTAYLPTEKYPKGLPQVAQPAMQMARNVAKNLVKKVNEEKLVSFSYFDKGSMATIGRNHAVVEIGKFHFGGFLGWALWLGLHLFYIIGAKNRLVIFLDWVWSYITYNNSLRIIVLPLGRKRHPIAFPHNQAAQARPADTNTQPGAQ